jgi:hypothetical protein
MCEALLGHGPSSLARDFRPPKARDDLRRVLIRDQADRDAVCKLYGWSQTFVG